MTFVPNTWLNVARSVQSIKEGEQICVEVEGGFVRRKSPVAGLLVTLRDGKTEVFVPFELMP